MGTETASAIPAEQDARRGDSGAAGRRASAIQLGYLWGGCSAALVLLAPFGRLFASGLPACPVRTFAHVPCPTCGSAHAALALARFDLAAAFAASPLAALGWIVLIVGGLAAGVAAARGHGVPEPPAALSWRWRAAVVAVVTLNWAYLIARG